MRRTSKPAVAALATLLAGVSHAACFPVQGVMTAVPDPSCLIKDAVVNWPTSIEAPDRLLALIQPDAPGACVAVSGTGTAQFAGVAGLTSVGAQGLIGSTVTPLAYEARPGEARQGVTGFTAQTALSGAVWLGRKKAVGTLYTKDTGVIGPDGKVGEILRIVGGTRDLQNASGTIAVAGQEMGGLAIYTGEVCLPN